MSLRTFVSRAQSWLPRRSSRGRNTMHVEEEQDDHGSSTDDTRSVDDNIETRRLKSVNSASGMSQEDLRKTIKEVNSDASLSPAEKASRIQELMTFSWRKSQERSKQTADNEMIRKGSYGSIKVKKMTAERILRPQSAGNVLERQHHFASTGSGHDSSDTSVADYDEEKDTDFVGLDTSSLGDDEVTVVQTFEDSAETIFGCKHYQRKCMLKAPCCGEYFTCRFCHDESCDHEINRYLIDTVRCMMCGHTQGVSKTCESCNTDFARYFCKKCNFYDDKPGKQIYHCDYCNICRIGEGLGIDYFHCHRCNACMSISLKDHKCVERSLESNCPVCSEFMFTSTIPVMFLPCGHCMHVGCYESYTTTNYTCPMCSKSMCNMETYFRRIDEVLEREVMPEEYRHLQNKIFCSDCEKRSVAPYHFLYHKCKNCGSYNTKVLEQVAASR